MQYATLPHPAPSIKFSIPGMLLALAGGVAAGAVAGALVYAISSAIEFGIPLMFPALLGGIAGYVTMRLGSTVGRCRSREVALGVAAMAAVAAWSSPHVIAYAQFRSEAFAYIAAEVPQASSRSIDNFIDQALREETGQPGLLGYILYEAQSKSVTLTGHHAYGATLGTLELTGPTLILYWLVELLVAAGVAVYINRSYWRAPFCDQCNVWRKSKSPITGSVDHVDEAIQALRQRDITSAVRALGTYESGVLVRLDIDYCPACGDNSTKLVTVRDNEEGRGWIERTVWSDKLDASSVHRVLELSN